MVDFVCLERKIVIEVDGGQHAIEKNTDNERDSWLEGQGFKVLRFWNNEVLKNVDEVLEVIRGDCLSPSPNPSHQGRGIYLDAIHLRLKVGAFWHMIRKVIGIQGGIWQFEASACCGTRTQTPITFLF